MKLSEKAQAALERVVEKFRRGDLSEMVQALAIEPAPDAPCHRWTFSNRALMAAQKMTQDARGFAQWRAVGRKVKKGATAGYIFAPYLRPTGEEDDSGKKKYEIRGWHTLALFAVQDTEPLDPEAPDTLSYRPRALPPLYGVAQRLGLSVSYAPRGANVNGSYIATPSSRDIVLHVHSHRTFWHELAHAAHHHADIVDFLPGARDAQAIAYREAVAELTAAVLGELYGEPSAGTSYAYLTQYYPDPLTGVTQALGVVGRVLDLITRLAEETDGAMVAEGQAEVRREP